MTPEDLNEGISLLEQLIFVYMRDTEKFLGDAIKAGLITGPAEQKLSEVRHEFVDTIGMYPHEVLGLISALGLKAGLAIVAVAAQAAHGAKKEGKQFTPEPQSH